MLSEDKKKKLSQGKDNSPVEAPPASTSKNTPQKVPNKDKQTQRAIRRASKGKGKGKAQMEQALPTELQNPKQRKDSQGKCAQYGKNSDGIQKQGGGKIEPVISKEVDLVKLVTHFETCNKEILRNYFL
ncbi:hypothetical protein O181_123884 [Austropuccinia psidii MF-1]|uniref:Uncharacterized protein n=1 Tax=Austropuccinia psidii MF-1 TaxID=1389203 RepID=A0A9Q3KQY9_9BASI|nr:hypothetical protein [Austropuccinia psidii MF-1]